ncbi:MAG: hypothetical protein ABFS38_22840, partial [Bacteroidota bacterium]
MKDLNQRTSFYGSFVILLFALLTGTAVFGQEAVKSEFQFNGYTNYWHDSYDEWHRYGNLFKMATPQVEKSILQSKVDIAEDLGVPGLLMEEGFMKGLLSGSHQTLDQPDPDQLEEALSKGDLLAFLDPGSEAGAQVISELPADW